MSDDKALRSISRYLSTLTTTYTSEEERERAREAVEAL